MNVIEQAISEFFSSPGRELAGVAKELGAMPLYRSWTGTVFLNRKGEFLFRDEELAPETVRVEEDRDVQLLALAEASRTYVTLANLLPARRAGADTCGRCNGQGQLDLNGGAKVFCGTCHGLGWPAGADWSPAELLNDPEPTRYPSFAEAIARFQAFTAKADPDGKPRFVAASDMVIRGQKLHVRLQDRFMAMKQARATYGHAARNRLGVLIFALGRTDTGEILTHVDGPRDAEEAERLMYPDGLKLSIASPFNIVPLVGSGDYS